MDQQRQQRGQPKGQRKGGRGRPGATRERALAFVRRCVKAGLPPTVREVQEALGLAAVESAREQLEKLVAEGRLAKEPGVARGYRLPADETPQPAWIPLLGRVQAGALSTAVEDREGEVPVDLRRHAPRRASSVRELRSARDLEERLFALRVRGESMRGAGILDGDVVIVRREPRAESGDIVVALVGDEATVKRLRTTRGQIELLPENPDFAPIALRAGEPFALLGKVIEVRRYLGAGVRAPAAIE
jgi:repressor LexA